MIETESLGGSVSLKGGRIAFIDCGMTGQADSRTTQQLADLVSGVVSGDVDRVITVVGWLGGLVLSNLQAPLGRVRRPSSPRDRRR